VTAGQIVPIVITVLVPIVTAMAGILGVMLQDWRVRKSQAGRRKLALEDASSQVSFAADWWNAKKLIADSPEVVQEAQKCVQDWLEEASARVIGSELPTARQRSPITLRRLLLFYPLQGRIANLIRGCFYVSLGVLISFVGFTISDVLESHQYLADDFINLIVSRSSHWSSGSGQFLPRRMNQKLAEPGQRDSAAHCCFTGSTAALPA
jgi:hypothetical protein